MKIQTVVIISTTVFISVFAALFVANYCNRALLQWQDRWLLSHNLLQSDLAAFIGASKKDAVKTGAEQQKLDLNALDEMARKSSSQTGQVAAVEASIQIRTTVAKALPEEQFEADYEIFQQTFQRQKTGNFDTHLSGIHSGEDTFFDPAYIGLGMLVSICGLLGGVCALTYDWVTKAQISDRTDVPRATIATLVCSLFAGPIGVFVLGNSDPTNWGRCALFAVICGLSWKGILQQAKLMGTSFGKNDTANSAATVPPAEVNNIAQSKSSTDLQKNADTASTAIAQKLVDAAGPIGSSELRLIAKNSSNQVINALYLQLSASSIKDDYLAALKGIFTIMTAATNMADLNLLEVGVDKIVGIASLGWQRNPRIDTKMEATNYLTQIRAQYAALIPSAKTEFITRRITDIQNLS